ncbi:MAG: DUF58 domain-containing protein [Candidatus Eisenbacteria bacterium]|uniref:DUF58 domain-containing protein n=1 Tax=Eiseniibacteriota bacterium TaxID=2212470 RepID=A0A956LZZ0_UNCEI|nr:DUF58 domain-containing protein [Candidatus Eisenbacteria bacterium]
MAATQQKERFLDPAIVGKLQRLDLIARLVVEGFLTGLHKSPYHGFSVEFAEHRQYMPGDEIRYLDWKVYAKSDRYYIKQFEEETNLRAHLLIDTSSSMLFSSDPERPSKLRYSINLAAALAFLMTQQQDAVGLLTFSDKIHRYVPPRSSQAHLRLLLKELEVEARRSLNRKGVEDEPRATRIGRCLEFLADRVQRRGLVVVLTAFWDQNENEVVRALKHFRHRQHEVVVFHVQDPAEAEFPYREEGVFVDLETGDRLNVLPWEAAKEFRQRLDARVDYYKKSCGSNGISFERLVTRSPYDLALLRYLEKRQRLH